MAIFACLSIMKKNGKYMLTSFEALFLKKTNNLFFQFARFLIAGAFAAGIDFLLLVLFVETLHFNYLFAGVVAYTIATMINYYLSHSWVFWEGRHAKEIELVGFFVASGVGLVLNQLVMWFCVAGFHIDYRAAKLFSIAIITLWSYLTKKYIVFKK